MDANQYQKLASRTLITEPGFVISGSDMMIVWCSVGLSGESGEIAELVKKGILHQHGTDIEWQTKMFKELGDVMWYVAGLCTTLGIDLSEVMEHNITKLELRYPNGFNSQDSITRKDVNG